VHGQTSSDVRQDDRLVRIERYLADGHGDCLGRDVADGLTRPQKVLPPKYLYDERGSELFDAICDLPEYYPTRTEEALLRGMARDLVGRIRPAQLIELGSGASRKTRVLLDALTEICPRASYVPVDVSEDMLRRSVRALRRAYPRLDVHGIVGDYERHLRHLPDAERRLVVFLGSTIGNFSEAEGEQFLSALRGQLDAGDYLLIGFDLVKPVEILHAAYNDSAGITAEFNRNVLRVLNRELEGDFDPDEFEHEAFFNSAASRIEMHLRARRAVDVTLAAIDLTVEFAAGESIRTEISRKFTRDSAHRLLRAGGFSPREWHVSPNGFFSLALARAGQQ
jgi:L-histidine N-alpha-methyltransferase